MNHLLFRDRLRASSSEILSMLSEFIDMNTLFVAVNDERENNILKAINQSEELVSEGTLPFMETYCSLVCRTADSSALIIPNTETDKLTCSMKVTQQIGATTFIGVPITLEDGTSIGTVCGMDRKPRVFSEREINLLYTASKFLSHVIELENMAFRDELTGAYTRNYLDEMWGTILSEHREFAVCVIDLDNFKSINDSYGHFMGDQVLKQIREEIQKQLSAQDLLLRMGGDEFLLIKPDCNSESELVYFMDKLVSAIGSIPKLKPGIGPSISVGVSLYPRDGTEIEDLIKIADKEMYYVKDTGKNNYSIWNQLSGI